MRYYTSEVQVNEGVRNTAGIKARDDIETILDSIGFQKLEMDVPKFNRTDSGILKKVKYHVDLKKIWDNKLECISKKDILVIQFPIIQHSIFLFKAIQKVKKRGGIIVLLIHDLEILRTAKRNEISIIKKIRLNFEEHSLLKKCNYMIVHNLQMKRKLQEMGYLTDKMVSLEIFDYIIPKAEEYELVDTRVFQKMPVVIAGTLKSHKAKYVYQLPTNVAFNLYGVGFEGNDTNNIVYKGAFPPDKLPYIMEGSFGLVWDGETCETCSGTYGEYLKINNPHKVSLYLASGMPVIIWNDAAMAQYIKEHRCGIGINTLGELAEVLKNITEDEYREMLQNAWKISKELQNGKNTKRVINEIEMQERGR